MRRNVLAILLTAGGSIVMGCDDSARPIVSAPLPPAHLATNPELEFLTWPSPPPLEMVETTFWAVRGEDREAEIRYWGEGPSPGGRFLRLRLRDQTLSRSPDGTPFLESDSVEIGIAVDPVRLMVTLTPTGLSFNPEAPAELELRFRTREGEFIQSGSPVGLWRQESHPEPWELLGPALVKAPDRIEARIDLRSFTRYALAIGR